LLHKGENKLRGGIGELGNLGKNGPRLYSTYNITIVKCGAFDFRFNFLNIWAKFGIYLKIFIII
jgi:hypothetical protein